VGSRFVSTNPMASPHAAQTSDCRNLVIATETSSRGAGFSTSDPRATRESAANYARFARSVYLLHRYNKCSFPFVMALATCFATGSENRRPLPVDAMIPDALFTSTTRSPDCFWRRLRGAFDSGVLPRWIGWIAVVGAVLCAAGRDRASGLIETETHHVSSFCVQDPRR
jgi:hypothetical protein